MTIKADIVMDAYYAQDKLQELWQTISLQHLSYLEMDDNPEKIEQRNKLEDNIKEYLCLTSHNKKFLLQETSQVLHRSASTKKDFSGYKAAQGWSAIGIYAANLLAQPWRKEYKTIKTYSGFYKHQVEANLVGAEIMFEAMGYRFDRNNSILILDGPVCPDRLINVSQDSLIAYVECQILKSIWEEVSKSFKISWLEVLEFRETHLCNPKQSVLALTYRHHEKQYLQHTRSYCQKSDNFIPASSQFSHPTYSSIPNNLSFPPVHNHIAPVLPVPTTAQYLYASNGYFGNSFTTYPQILPAQHYPCNYPTSCNLSLPKPYHANNNNNYCCVNGYSLGLSHDYAAQQQPIPTGQLIDVDSRGNTYDIPDGKVKPITTTYGGHSSTFHQPMENSTSYGESVRNSSHAANTQYSPQIFEKEVPAALIDSWDYVYRDLESQGYSKDLGERGDLLTLDTTNKNKNLTKKTGLEENFSNLSLKKPANKLKEENKKEIEKKIMANSTVKIDTVPKKTSLTKIGSGIQEALNKKVDNSKSKSLISKKPKIKDKENKIEVKTDSLEKQEAEWECNTCTFLNKESVDICEICGKSRRKVEEVMEVGGSECPKCTLVNPKNINFCKACSSSLANSPTYI